LPCRLLHMKHWWSRIILHLVSSSILNLLRWILYSLDIIIFSLCCSLLASTGMIDLLSW
jgi:hypothetical protein